MKTTSMTSKSVKINIKRKKSEVAKCEAATFEATKCEETINEAVNKAIDHEVFMSGMHMDDLMTKLQGMKDLDFSENKLEGKGVLAHLEDNAEDPFKLIESYFEGKHLERLVRHQLESYNHFVNLQIQRTIQMFNPVEIRADTDYVPEHDKYMLEVFITFENFKMYPPQIHENNGATKLMLPQEAKLRNFTYAASMALDLRIKYVIRNTESMDTPRVVETFLPKITIGKMPIMLKSSICVLTQNNHIHHGYTGECSMDCGGYFIIKGSEKTVLGQEHAKPNCCYNFKGNATTKWSWFSEIKSVPDYKCISPKQIEMMIASKNNGFGNGMYINIPRIKQPIELFVLFRALGVLSEKEICSYIVLYLADDKYADILKFLRASIIDANKYMTQEDALRHVTSMVTYMPMNMDKEQGAKKKREFAVDVLNSDLFPHCHNLKQKLHLLGYMANKLIQTALGWLPVDDRDSYLNKRIELTGTLLNNLFRNYFNKLVKEMQKQIVREIKTGSWRSTEDYENIVNMTNIYKIMKSTTIENGINRALATGDFSIKQSNSSKVGVAQVLNRLTYPASISHLRRINTPLEKSGELIAPRKLHNTTFGFLCLTGDSEVLMSDGITTKKIKDMTNADRVMTVNPQTLEDVPSDIHSFFSKMPDKLFEITTVSGRKIKATANHPFLVDNNGTNEWRNLENLWPHDKLFIRHATKYIADENTTTVQINEALEHYKAELLALNLLNSNIPLYKLKIIARFVGLLHNNCGQLYETEENNELKYSVVFDIQSEKDALQMVKDIETVGFYCTTITEDFSKMKIVVSKDDAFAYVLFLLAGIIGRKQFDIFSHWLFIVPDWLYNAELSVKREFISAYQYGFVPTETVHTVCKSTHNDYVDNAIYYMKQMRDMFNCFGINVVVQPVKLTITTTNVYLAFENKLDNFAKYVDTFHTVYCEKKRIVNALIIEQLKIGRSDDGSCCVKGDCVSVPILSIVEIEPELVYDFTTMSDNHSFVASSFVTHNCPAETPEGQSIGVVKNMSYLTHITIPTNSSSLYEYAQPYLQSVETTEFAKLANKVKVFVNGVWLGVTDRPMELYRDMKDKKYRGIINIYTGIVFDFKMMEIRICNDGGRLTRPVLKVRNNRALITKEIIDRIENKELSWNDLLTNCVLDESVIEYIDPEEQNYAMIAMRAKDTYLKDPATVYTYTHCEIHPSTIFGVLASCIPFPEHNQAPRNTYQTAMGKQAMGVYATNYDKRMDKTAYVLNYPTRPLVETRLMNFIHLNNIPSGCQIHVAIMTHTGYNQEDSVLVNKGSIDRGLFMATIYHTEKDEDKNIIRDEIIRCKPDKTKTKGVKFGNYDKLNSQGFIAENSLVENRDIIIGKIIPIKENRNDPTKTIKYEDQSKSFRTTEETYIDMNRTFRNGDGYNCAKVRTRTLRKPVLGDKFSSRHGQKGTMGNILPECDMPFTKDGLRPDIIINPHAIPSRMTIAQLKETLLGKVLLVLGLFGDGTSFGTLDVKTISEKLQNVGYESYGNEVMYNGLTGEQLETNIFFGPVFYQRLKHMVNDKQHSRSIGPMVNLTRQPAEGRSRDGGFRVGEMERDVLIAHGMSRFCKERLYDVSDKYSVHVCKKCGMIASYNNNDRPNMYYKDEMSNFTIHLCNTCGNQTDFAKVDVPYAYKLMAQELQTINIVPRIITE